MSIKNSIFNITNEYESFIEKLIYKTESGEQKWAPSTISTFIAKYVKDFEKSYRNYIADANGRKFILTEKKIPLYETDYDDFYEKVFVELYIINQDNLEIKIDDSIASENLLLSLSKVVARKSSNLDNFLESY